MAAFTLTSTLKSADLGAKIQATGAISGLEKSTKHRFHAYARK
jgi:hypothetical protein